MSLLRFPLMLMLLTMLLLGCQQMYPMKGTSHHIVTFGDVWSPGFTAIVDDQGQIVHLIAGESGVGQISTGAGIAVSGALVGEGLRESGDEISGGSASAQSGGATAVAQGSATIIR